MFSFDQQSNILKVFKVPEQDLTLDLLQYQKESYRKYITETIYSDIDHLLQSMREVLQVSDVQADVKVTGPHIAGGVREVRKQSPAYYSVQLKFSIDGVSYANTVEALRIPVMDDDGVLNVNGNRRVLLMQMVAAERISYAEEKKTVSITTPKRNISIMLDGAKDVMVKYGTSTAIPMHKIVRAFNAKEGVYKDPSSLFASAAALSAFSIDRNATDEAIVDELDKLKVYAQYTGDDYRLGQTRDALNEALSLDRAKGRILSRPVGPYGVGARVTEEVLTYTRRNCINELYVKCLPDIAGYKLTSGQWIFELPAGTHNNDKLREELPQFANYESLPQNCSVQILLDDKEALTTDDVQMLYDAGLGVVSCRRTGGKDILAYFEEEIIGNYTVRLGDVFGHNIPGGRSYDEWVCFYDNPNFEPRDMDHLNIHDIIALYSLCLFIRRHPEENYLLDKDFGLLKRVQAANEIFSNTFQEIALEFVRKYRSSISKAIASNVLRESNFIGLTDMWVNRMWKNNYLVIADTINPIATIAQTNHLISGARIKTVSEKMRLLSMSYYGRICPYETPESQKLGTTNTKAVGAKIKDGMLTTPYRKVLKNSLDEIIGVSDNLRYMDAQEEARYRIGDILSLKQVDGKYVNTKVMARVPAPHNQVTVESVDAFTLDYVNAYCEQHLSPTASLVPLMGSDDAVRITGASKMLKQSILVQGNQVPRVMTSMYRHCFDHSNTYVIRAKESGVVFDIPIGKLQLLYDNGEQENIEIHETAVTTQSVNFLNFHVKEGDRFKKGDILVDSAIAREGIYSPGVNLFVAYTSDGYNYEDAVELSEYAANQCVSISTEKVSCKVGRRGNESVRVGRENQYRYIPENGVIAKVHRHSTDDTRRRSTSTIRSGIKSGILYQIARNHQEKRATEYNAYLLAFNKIKTGDKMAGRHANKGTVSTIKKNSEMPCFLNGRPVDLLLNPCGVPSRMNIGQCFEAYLGFVATLLDIHIESNPFNGATRGDIKLLMQYVWDLANTSNPNVVCEKYPMLPAPIHERAKQRHGDIRMWEGCFTPDGKAFLWNPESGKCLENPVMFGVSYFLKLEHEVNHKMHSRGGLLEEDYSQISNQPTEGAAQGGGQKMGEMELCALAAYGAVDLLHETQNGVSDNVIQRIEMTLKSLGIDESLGGYESLPYAVEMCRYYLEVLGYKLEDTEHMFPTKAEGRTVPDIRGMLTHKAQQEKDRGRSVHSLLKEVFGDG